MTNQVNTSRFIGWPRVIALVLSLAAIVTVAVTANVSAHVAYRSGGVFLHQTHGRNFGFYNGIDHSTWRAEMRDAQLDWHGYMSGALTFYTTTHASSIIHAVDDNYGNTGWVGYAWNWGQHNGHGHAQMNTYSLGSIDARRMQKTSCHEIGHFVGLDHTDTETDCMKSGGNYTSVTIGYGTNHGNELRTAYTQTGH